jgi:hypothetical protein
MKPAHVPTCLVLVGALAIIPACGDEDESDFGPAFLDCIEIIRTDDLTSPDCRRREQAICWAVAQEIPFVTRARITSANVKGTVRDLARLAGIAVGPWSRADCIATHKGICKDFAPSNPCYYETCLAEIPQDCKQSGGR